MKTPTLLASFIALNLAAFGFVACGADPGGAPLTEPTDDEVGTLTDEIIGGTNSAAGTAETNGWVRVNHGGTCSGTLIRNDMVITAKHCTTTDGQINGPVDDTLANYSISMGPAANNRAITGIIRNASRDVALIQLGNFMPVSPSLSRFDFRRAIYSGTNASLQGSSLLCYGYGNNAITDCEPDRTGTGSGTLRQGNITISTTTTTSLTFLPTGANGTIQFRGDSGGSCFLGASMVGIHSTGQCSDSPLAVTSTNQVGPEAYRTWAEGILADRGPINVHRAATSNISGHITTISHSTLNSTPSAFVHQTANWNPGGTGGTYNNAHTGLWFDGGAARWKIFNQGFTAMPANAAFNWWKVAAGVKHTASSGTIVAGMPHVTRINLGTTALNSNPNLILVVSQLWEGVYNNHAVGVWFDPVSARWHIYNEDQVALPLNAKFNISVVDTAQGAFVHTSTAASISGNSTYLNNANINGQPNAQFVVTHNFKLGGGNVGTYHTPAVGVWFDTARQQWAVFNQSGAAMVAGLTFNVMVRP